MHDELGAKFREAQTSSEHHLFLQPWIGVKLPTTPWDVARNSIVDKFLDVGARWLFFLDSDVLCPEHALERLMSHNVPIVGGLFYRRHLDRPGMVAHPAIWKLVPAGVKVTCSACQAVHTTKEGKYQPILNPPPNRLIEVDTQGAGCLLIHRRVFEKVEKPWFRWTLGWVDPGVCVAPGQSVFGGSVIEETAIGEEILNGGGDASNVGSIHVRNFNGDAVRITPNLFRLPILVSPEHKILGLDGVRRIYPKNPDKPYWKMDSVSESWKRADEIKKGDFVAFPIPKESPTGFIDLSEWGLFPDGDGVYRHPKEEYSRRRWFTGRSLPRRITLNREFGHLIGFYLAEGSITAIKGNMVLSFGLSEKEISLANNASKLLEKVLGLPSRIKRGTHSWNVCFNSAPLAYLFRKWFGKDARTKKIPLWVIRGPREFVEGVIRGMWGGDGYVTYTGKRFPLIGINIASKDLALGVASLWLRLGVRCQVRYYKQYAGAMGEEIYHVKTTESNAFEILELQVDQPVRKENHGGGAGLFYAGKFWFKASKVERIPYKGPMYDLSLFPRDSYVLEGIIVHNSEDFYFMERCIDAGFKPLCDTGIRCGHTGDFVVDGMGQIASPGV